KKKSQQEPSKEYLEDLDNLLEEETRLDETSEKETNDEMILQLDEAPRRKPAWHRYLEVTLEGKVLKPLVEEPPTTLDSKALSNHLKYIFFKS
ncbi:UNVERIFIED_CONTAM: hypothetical protein ITH36_25165, partial [Salmonella enterica subsp. enterica serovar Weltevreden]